jgi:hypothetical protein
MKKELRDAREQIQENLQIVLDGMPDACLTAACQAVVNGFAPLMEAAEEKTRKAVYVTQIGDSGYRVDKVTNILDQPTGKTVKMADLKEFLDKGVSVHISRNK